MRIIFACVVLGVLIALVLFELFRFRRARFDAEEVPYPSSQLRRRLMIAILFGAAVGLAAYWPDHAAIHIHLILLALVSGLVLSGLALLWRDLVQTSRAAVEHAQHLDQHASAQFREILDKARTGERGQP